MTLRNRYLGALIALLLTSAAGAQTVKVQDGWARATVQGQKATGAFMQLTAPAGATLVGVRSPVAGLAEVHEMQMDGDVMRMRPLTQGLELPAGTTVRLQPGGYHLMLMDLKVPLQKDSTIPLTLILRDGKGVQSTQDVRIPVLTSPPAGRAAEHQHGN